jgi:hypothetical protein
LRRFGFIGKDSTHTHRDKGEKSMQTLQAFSQDMSHMLAPVTDTVVDRPASPAASSQFALLGVALLAYALTAKGQEFTRAQFGSGAVIAFGKRVFLFIAVRAPVREVLKDRFLRMLGRYVLIPSAALYALGVGIGLGLQQIAANFVSGMILLVKGQTTVGDYVELDGGEAGTIIKMTARACVLKTFDGKWIVVPNDHFITTRMVNYSDQGSANRYKAVAALPFVLTKPDGPNCELRGFGKSGIDFAAEYWVSGIDDGRNKYQSKVFFAIWNTLKDHGVKTPYPHRVVEIKGQATAL